MNESTFEYACMRAELLGLDKPNEDAFNAKRKEALEKEMEESAIQHIEDGSVIGEGLDRTKGGFAELGSVLASTQSKINRIKGACGNITNLLREKLSGSRGDLSYSSAPSYLEQPGFARAPSSAEKGPGPEPDINEALDVLDSMKATKETSDAEFCKDKLKDAKKQTEGHINKLDALINAADRAELSMSKQNKQMKKFLR